MKRKSNALLLILCAVLLVSGTVLGTLAYLTDRDEVVNTFTVGDVQIKLDEVEVTPDGQPVQDDDGNLIRQEEGNEYHLIPGKTYVKDPTVTVEAGSEASYVRMMVTINCISELKEIFGDDFLPQDYVDGWDPEKWACVDVTDNGDNTVTYEFRYHSIVDAFESEDDIVLEPLFTHFTIPGEITGEELATIADLEIAVMGHAIQSTTFENADDAWAAFENQYNP